MITADVDVFVFNLAPEDCYVADRLLFDIYRFKINMFEQNYIF